MSRSAEDWSARRLHFVGIGGAGMSGLAIIARELGASVTGSDRADRATPSACASTGSSRCSGTGRKTCPPGPRSCSRPPCRRTIPSAGPRGARAAPRRPARADRRAAPLPGGHRHARQDDDRGDDRPHPARVRARSRVRGRRRARRHRGQRRLGARRVDRRRGRRVGPLAAQAVARDRGADQRRARPSLDLRLAAGPRADVPRVHGSRGARRGRLGPPAAAGAVPRRARSPTTPPTPRCLRAARGFTGAGSRCRCRFRASTTPSTPPAR